MKNSKMYEHDYEEDIGFKIISDNKKAYTNINHMNAINYIRDTSYINQDDELILKNLEEKQRQLKETILLLEERHQSLDSLLQKFDCTFDYNNADLNLQNNSVKYLFNINNIKHKRIPLGFICIIVSTISILWFTINAPPLPRAAIALG